MRKFVFVLLGLALLVGSLTPIASAATAPKAEVKSTTKKVSTGVTAQQIRAAVTPLLGIRYRYGSENPKRGLDCSGFLKNVYKKFGITLPRSSVAQSKIGVRVSKQNLKPGDLVFFNTNGRRISHVGVYMGGGKFAHAASSSGTRISSLSESYYMKRYVTARRVIGI